MYLPSQEEIKAKCLKIQSNWTELDRKNRYWLKPKILTVKTASVASNDIHREKNGTK